MAEKRLTSLKARNLFLGISRMDRRCSSGTQRISPKKVVSEPKKQASKPFFYAYPLNSDATALKKAVAAVVSGLKSERKVAKEEGFTRNAFQKHVELYSFVLTLFCVMLVCTANVTHAAKACEDLYTVVARVAIEVFLR